MSIVATTLYVFLKRTNMTVQVYTEPQQTIEALKAYFAKIVKVAPSEIRLLYDDQVMEDAKTIQDYKIDTRSVGQTILFVYKNGDGEWEKPNLHNPTPPPVDRSSIESIKLQQQTKPEQQ